MGKVRDELTQWFTVLSRYVGMTGLIYEVTTHHDDPRIIAVLAAMMGLGHIFPSRTARALTIRLDDRREINRRRAYDDLDLTDEETPR